MHAHSVCTNAVTLPSSDVSHLVSAGVAGTTGVECAVVQSLLLVSPACARVTTGAGPTLALILLAACRSAPSESSPRTTSPEGK